METITGDDVRKAMISAGWMHPLDNPLMYIMDREFIPADEKAIWRVIYDDPTEKRKYISELYDCDDFAFDLNGAVNKNKNTMGMATGILIIETLADPNNLGNRGLHAIFFYCTGYRVEAVEPQNDSPFNRPFKVRGVVMY